MIASDVIANEIPAVKLTNTVNTVLSWMDDFKVSHMAVVDKGKFIGIINEGDLLDIDDPSKKIGECDLELDPSFAINSQHAFEVVNLISANNLTALAVLDQNKKYIGVVSLPVLVDKLSKIAAFENPGSIITLELNLNDYSLAEIARIVESNDAKILSSYVTSHSNSTKLEVTLKISKQEISDIIQTFNRYNYNITGSYNAQEYFSDMKDRYDEFMRYLNT